MKTTTIGRAQMERWRDAVRFCSEVLHDPETGQPFQLYDAEVDFLRRAFELTPDGKMRFSELVFSGPKKSGKTGLAGMIAVYTAVVLAGNRGEIYCLANDLEQSQSRVFAAVVAILQASPLLRHSFRLSGNRIAFRANGTAIVALPNDYKGFAGANPTLNVYDESAYYTSEGSRRLWDEGIPSPARRISFRLSVSTAGFEGEPSPLRDLYDRAMEHGVEVAPDTRVHENLLCYWTHECRAPWQSPAWIAEMQRTLRAAQFKRLVCNEWTSSEATFVEMHEWDACTDSGLRPVISEPALQVWCGLDLGLRHDATALMVVARDGDKLRLVHHKVFIPKRGETLDIESTAETAVLELRARFHIRAVAYDWWQGELLSQRLQRAGVPMAKIDQNVPNLSSMASTLIDLIRNRQLVLYPSDELRQAAARTVVIESSRGWRLGKSKGSDRVDPIVSIPECPFVFHDNGEPLGDYRKAWRAACREAGFDGLLIHDLRRSAVRNLTHAGNSDVAAMKITGHLTKSVFDRYNIVSEADLVATMERQSAYIEAKIKEGPKVIPLHPKAA